MAELKAAAATTRRQSPSKRSYGRVEPVDANGYLDAIEKVSKDTVVVVVVYSDRVASANFSLSPRIPLLTRVLFSLPSAALH